MALAMQIVVLPDGQELPPLETWWAVLCLVTLVGTIILSAWFSYRLQWSIGKAATSILCFSAMFWLSPHAITSLALIGSALGMVLGLVLILNNKLN